MNIADQLREADEWLELLNEVGYDQEALDAAQLEYLRLVNRAGAALLTD